MLDAAAVLHRIEATVSQEMCPIAASWPAAFGDWTETRLSFMNAPAALLAQDRSAPARTSGGSAALAGLLKPWRPVPQVRRPVQAAGQPGANNGGTGGDRPEGRPAASHVPGLRGPGANPQGAPRPRPPARPWLTTSAKPGSDTWRLGTAAGSHRLCLSFRKQAGSLSDRQTVAPACL